MPWPEPWPGGVSTAPARREMALAAAKGLIPLPFSHPAYPARLRDIPDPPVLLYALGDPGLLSRPSVALVGARQCSRYGFETAWRIAVDLSAAGITVGVRPGLRHRPPSPSGRADRPRLLGGGARHRPGSGLSRRQSRRLAPTGRRRSHRQRVRPGHTAPGPEFSHPQPDHRRSVPRRPGGGSGRPLGQPHHGPAGPGPGPRGFRPCPARSACPPLSVAIPCWPRAPPWCSRPRTS